LQNAIAAANVGTTENPVTVELLRDVNLGKNAVTCDSGMVILKTNGHTITYEDPDGNQGTAAISVNGTGNFTLLGDGVGDGKPDIKLTGQKNYSRACAIKVNGTCKVEKAVLEATGTKMNFNGIRNESGALTVVDSNIKAEMNLISTKSDYRGKTSIENCQWEGSVSLSDNSSIKNSRIVKADSATYAVDLERNYATETVLTMDNSQIIADNGNALMLGGEKLLLKNGSSIVGTQGNAAIVVYTSSNKIYQIDNGMIFGPCYARSSAFETPEGLAYTVAGAVNLPQSLTIPSGADLQTKEGASLTIPAGMTLSNKGMLHIDGAVDRLTVNGTLNGSGTFYAKDVSTDMIRVPENLIYTGSDQTAQALAGISLVGTGTTTVDTSTFQLTADVSQWVKSVEPATVREGGTYEAVYTRDGKSVRKEFSVGKSATTFGSSLKSYESNGTRESSRFTYGDTIIVKATPTATGTAATSLLSRLRTAFAAPQADQMALYVNKNGSEIAVSDPVSAMNGVYAMTIDTKEKNLIIGANTVTAKYVGNDSKADYSEQIQITLDVKPLTGVTVKTGAGHTFAPSRIILGGKDASYYSLDKADVTGRVKITPKDITTTGQNKNTVVDSGVGTFKEPTGDGIVQEEIPGTVSYSYNGKTTYEEVVEELKKLSTGAVVDVPYIFTPMAGGNYSGTISGNIAVTVLERETLAGNITISGEHTVGSILTVSIPSNPDIASEDYTIAWYRDNVVISRATDRRYTVTNQDLGKTIKVILTAAENSTKYKGTLISESVGIPNAAGGSGGNTSGSSSSGSGSSSSGSGSSSSGSSSSSTVTPSAATPASNIQPTAPATTTEPVTTLPAATEVPAQTTTTPTQTPVRPSAGAGTVLDSTPEDPTEAPFLVGEDGQQGWDVIKGDVTDKFTEALETAGVDISEITDEDGRIDLDKLAENPDVLDALSGLETPLEATINMNGATELPSEMIALIAGKNINLILDMGNGIQWTINGNSVTGEDFGDIDLGVSIDSDAIPVDVVNEISGEHYNMSIEIAHDGEFGFEATLSINMKEENAGYYANLFYYNEETEALEFLNCAQIDDKGKVALTFTHASAYTIVVSEEPMNADNLTASADTDGTDTSVTPKTPDTMETPSQGISVVVWIILGVVIMIMAAAGIYFLKKKEEKKWAIAKTEVSVEDRLRFIVNTDVKKRVCDNKHIRFLYYLLRFRLFSCSKKRIGIVNKTD